MRFFMLSLQLTWAYQILFAGLLTCLPLESIHALENFDQHLYIDRPEVLSRLYELGFSPARLLNISRDPSENQVRYVLSQPSLFQLRETLSNRLASRFNPAKGTSYAITSAHRLFNPDWFKSEMTRFDLVGVINRIDRQFLTPKGCGETRLIYRLSYSQKNPSTYSRLPLTMMMIFQPPIDCASWVTLWASTNEIIDSGNIARLSVVLRPFFQSQNLSSIEFNLQSERWPSTIKPDTSGYAEYDMWAFVYNKARNSFEAGPLENTPDMRLLAQPVLTKQLLDFIKTPNNLKSLDEGRLVLPEKFLARSATSYSFHGNSRASNHPFSLLFKPDDFKDIDFKKFHHIKSPELLLMRLNDHTCTGCHQSRTIAGFHFLGTDQISTSPYNSVFNGASPHFRAELSYRNNVFKSFQLNQRLTLPRDFSTRGNSEIPVTYSSCSISPSMPIEWGCPTGHTCERHNLLIDSPIGRCEPLRPAPPPQTVGALASNPSIDALRSKEIRNTLTSEPKAGTACNVGNFASGADPHLDRILNQKDLSCGTKGVCEKPLQGFPGGLCTRPCQNIGANEICGPIALLGPFNKCLTTRAPFDFCLKSSIRMSALQSCNQQELCRNDYVCTSVQGSLKGACIPPYFLLQLRVDGHPDPLGRSPTSTFKPRKVPRKKKVH